MKANKTKRAERLGQIKAWKNSGLTIIAFCEKAGIAKENFYYWRRKFRDEKEASIKSKGAFISLSELKPPNPKPADAKEEKQAYEFIFPNGIILQVNGRLSLDLLKTIKDV
jgi:transposase-like protein